MNAMEKTMERAAEAATEKAIQPIVVSASQRERFALGGDLYGLIARSEHTQGQFAIYETMAPPGHGAMKHIHSHESESFLMLSGELTVTAGQTRKVLGQGDFIHFPTGCAYSFRNEGKESARFITFLVPAGLERFLASVGQPVAADASHAEPTHDSIAEMVKQAKAYGVEYPEWR